eukprot:CAMPEP_0202469510 /NCGR_PEP_ID=MMETSP1360-20130828/78774_1 /ASSEMBLY_ACC=CAM_ASM_000848 /TAXON_ID=515479 /ORGANISM="Licmophora paradoxa, Strain CCMP2313" /LENGTH=55 /DNA_ID=CAMNT_0049094879 /DNA_START=24 /DNA_END=188 /DNA_ORIENTATION=+
MADAAAAAMDQASPTLNSMELPSYARRAVPASAVRADIHVGRDICLLNKMKAKKG